MYIYAFYISKLFYTFVSMAQRPKVRMLISGVVLIVLLISAHLMLKYTASAFIELIRCWYSYGIGYLTL